MSPTDSTSCPCGSGLKLDQCCLPYLQGKKKPVTAEDLLRSRYTAFTRGDIDYILNTHHSKTKQEVNRESIEQWSKNSEWLGLTILEKESGMAADQIGSIQFRVQYKQDGETQEHLEQSLFQREDGDWKFVDGRDPRNTTVRRTEPKVGRNDPCPCGSGKKFKKCHGTA